MEGSIHIPQSPGAPLFPVSPERTNRQPIPHSPSMPVLSPRLLDDPFASNSHRGSDVRDKVAQFNNLGKDFVQKRHENDAARRRAEMAREQAESENKMLKRQLTETEDRVGKVSQRLETVMEDKQRAETEKQKFKTVYEKEIRRARKEAFKCSSENIKLTEELRATRNALTILRDDMDEKKSKIALKEQEAFAAQYKLVDVEEELARLCQQMRLVEEERDALKTSLKEEEVARIAAEGKIPLPMPVDKDELSSPRKQQQNSRLVVQTQLQEEEIYAEDPDNSTRLAFVQAQYDAERKGRRRAEDLVDFMKLECQLQRCCCRLSDDRVSNVLARNDVREKNVETILPLDSGEPSTPHASQKLPEDDTCEPLIEFSPNSGALRNIETPKQTGVEVSNLSPQQESLEAQDELQTSLPSTLAPPPLEPITISESPSALSLSETEMSGRTSSNHEDDCLILPGPPAPKTPKAPHFAAITLPVRLQQPLTEPRASHQAILPLSPLQAPSQHQNLTNNGTTDSRDDANVTAPISLGYSSASTRSVFISHTTTTTIPLAGDPRTPTAADRRSGNQQSEQQQEQDQEQEQKQGQEQEQRGRPLGPAFPKSPATATMIGTTKTREEALQSIERWRRGRSRSVVLRGTPRRVAPGLAKREVSAPVPVAGGKPGEKTLGPMTA